MFSIGHFTGMWITVVTFGRMGNGSVSSSRTGEPSAAAAPFLGDYGGELTGSRMELCLLPDSDNFERTDP